MLVALSRAHQHDCQERARLIREHIYALEVQKVKNQISLTGKASTMSTTDLLLSTTTDKDKDKDQQQQQLPQRALLLVPGEPVSDGARAVAAQVLQDRLQRHIDEQVGCR